MGETGKIHGDFDIPEDYVGELVAASLTANSWNQPKYNDLLVEITAEQRKNERRSGIAFDLEYRATVTWKFLGDGKVRIITTVAESAGNALKRDCERLAVDVLKGIAQRLETLKESLKRAKPRTNYGTSKWADEEALQTAGYVAETVEGNSLLLGPGPDGKRIVIPPEDTARHCMVCGPTGCGKSSSIFKPNLFERIKVSAIVTEATPGNNPPDLYTTTSGYRQQQGHQIYYFNPDDMRSVRINPLDAVTTVSKAQDVSDLIIRNTIMTKNTGGDPIWEVSERHLLTALLMHFAPEGADLAAVRSLIREGAVGIGKVLENSKTEGARVEYKGFMNVSSEGFRNGVLSGLLQRLRLWANPRIVALTRKTDLDIKSLPNQLFTFYLAVPSEKESIKAVAALVFNYIMNEVVLGTEPEKFKYPMALFLDEFTNFGMIPGITRSLTLLRHRKTPIMFGIQDYVQLRSTYSEDDARLFFGQPATRVIFRTPDLETARKVSEALGKQTVVERKLTSSCQVTEREFGKDLMSAAEVMAMDKELSLFFTPGTGPVKLKRFSWKDYEEQLKILPPHREPLHVDDDLVKKCQALDEQPKWEKEWDDQERNRQTGTALTIVDPVAAQKAASLAAAEKAAAEKAAADKAAAETAAAETAAADKAATEKAAADQEAADLAAKKAALEAALADITAAEKALADKRAAADKILADLQNEKAVAQKAAAEQAAAENAATQKAAAEEALKKQQQEDQEWELPI